MSGNINSKVEFEQNKILEIFTVVTAYVSSFTVIVVIYEMNF
ncbi:hypothetical protein ACXR6G_09785 [Ancylomarina sp. YFZ004]